MIIENKVTEKSYNQWVEKFVTDVLTKANITCDKVVIDDIEFNKRIFLTIDGAEYTIRTWNFHPVEEDSEGKTCSEDVSYTLYRMVDSSYSGKSGEVVNESICNIKWENK